MFYVNVLQAQLTRGRLALEIEHLIERHPDHWSRACAIRTLAMDAVQAANSGHPGMPMGMADVATVLFEKHLKFDASCPQWPDRDRLVLSAGHGSMLIYALLHLTGYKDFTIDQLKSFRQLGSLTPGHPEFGHGAGIETTTGPLGQGFANAVGMAIAEEALHSRFGRKLVDHYTFAIVGDGCLMEGISHEAAGLAGKLKLSRLIVLFDDNQISIDGPVSLSDITDQTERFKSYGWNVQNCDGHNVEAIDTAINQAKSSDRPSLIAFRTIIGLGSPNKQGKASSHGSPLGAEEINATKSAYSWPYGPFEIPQSIKEMWLEIGRQGRIKRLAWESRLSELTPRLQARFNREINGDPPKRLNFLVNGLKKDASHNQPVIATRKSSELVLSSINPILPEVIGGSADLTGSNNTKTKDLAVFTDDFRGGRYIYYGIREHAMAGAMNGMALHGGIKPYGGTFLCFADYARPSIRLSALMNLPVIYVMTHDSIGLGEDGPTHQPVEHLAMLRATPNLNVYRPCDTVETAEAWQAALTSKHTPSVLVLTRQSLPTLRTRYQRVNKCLSGAYILAESNSPRQVILLASGSETSIAIEAKQILEKRQIGTRVVSMPCWEQFEIQDDTYKRKILPRGSVRIAIEAGVRQGWDRWLFGVNGNEKKSAFVGMQSYGASAPAKDLFKHFQITAENVVNHAENLL